MFLLRFPDDRILAIAVLFSALTLMLLRAAQPINQGPIGGIRFFVIAGILPTLFRAVHVLTPSARTSAP
jgi:hypothetical protein